MTQLIVAGQKKEESQSAVGDSRVLTLGTDALWKEVLSGEIGRSFWRVKELVRNTQRVHFAIDAPDNVLYRTGGQLYRSMFGDILAWEKVPNLQLYCQDIAIDSFGNYWAITSDAADADILSTVDASRIWKGTGGGNQWTQKYVLGQDGFGVIASRKPQAWNIAVNPTDSNIIVVHGSETIANGTRLWRSLDNGETWSGFNPGLGTNSTAGRVRAFGYNAAGVLAIVQNNSANTEMRFSDSADNGTSFTLRFTVTTSNTIHQQLIFDTEGYDWWLSEDRLYRISLDRLTFTLIALNSDAPFTGGTEFSAIRVEDGYIYLGTNCGTCTGTRRPLFRRKVDLSDSWTAFADTMPADLGYSLRINTQGLLGATAFSSGIPPDEPHPPQCIDMIGWEVDVGGQGGYYSRSRAMGMGLQNAGGNETVFIADAETIWEPDTGSGCFGSEHGPYHVRREIIVNDYGINKSTELKALAGSYLPNKEKSFGGFTVIRFTVGGILRATASAPTPFKPLQAGDEIQLSNTCSGTCKIDGGTWVVDEICYNFPEGTSDITISRRPASQTGSYPMGNVRQLGESLAGTGQVFESEWFHVLEPRFKAGTIIQTDPGLYDLFTFNHYMGVIPSEIIMVAAKRKIFNWYDDAEVAAGQPLYVPRLALFDHTQVQGVGYDEVRRDETTISLQFRRFLFYDEIENKWVKTEERFIKMWVLP